ncbi:MAG: hypothetical protein ACJAYU_003088 [Bradymonadia bacterium]|jgi:hypothetical protein
MQRGPTDGCAMKRLQYILLAALIACGGDDPEPTGDTGAADASDVAADADAAVDSEPDVAPTDTGNEPDLPPADPPEISSIRPNEGRLESQQRVAIIGRNFAAPCSVDFGGSAATGVSIVNDQALDLRAPAGDEAGTVDVVVTCRGGTATLEDGYTYTVEAEVTVTDYTPLVGLAEGNELVTFLGTNFDAEERTQVRFGDDFATGVEVVDASTITALTPESAPGVASVSVEVGSQRVDMESPFTFIRPLTVEAITPFAINRAGGTVVELVGSDLVDFAEIEVRFGELLADEVSFEFSDDGATLVVEAPISEELGLVDVTVTGLLAEVVLEGACAFVDPIVVDSMEPDAVPISGVNRVTLIGERFDSAVEPLQVFVGDEEAFDVTVDSTTQVSFLVPPVAPGRHEVRLVHGFEEVIAPEELDVFSPISVTGISPEFGTSVGGTRVDISGAGFVDGVIVLFGGTLGTDVAVAADGNSLSVTSPEGTGTVDVVVQSPFSSDTLEGVFTYATEE